MKRSPVGFTLLEVVIASSLTVIVLMSFTQLLAIQSKVASEEVQDTDAQTGILRGMSNMLPLLQESRPTNFYAGNNFNDNRYLFRVPVKALDGTPLTRPSKKTGRTHFKFGAGNPGGMTEGGYYEILFQPGYDDSTGVGRSEEQLDESKLPGPDGTPGLDLNGDGDKDDIYTFGTLLLREYTPSNVLVEERVLGGRVCLPMNGPNIFDLKGFKLTITLMYADIRTKLGEVSRLKQTQTMINLRNGKPPEPPDTSDPLENY